MKQNLRYHTMTDTERVILLSPATTDGVNITGADATSINLDIYVVIAKWLWLELVLVKFLPRVRSIDLEAFKGIWVNHCDMSGVWGVGGL
jgi:hypothetical protein